MKRGRETRAADSSWIPTGRRWTATKTDDRWSKYLQIHLINFPLRGLSMDRWIVSALLVSLIWRQRKTQGKETEVSSKDRHDSAALIQKHRSSVMSWQTVKTRCPTAGGSAGGSAAVGQQEQIQTEDGEVRGEQDSGFCCIIDERSSKRSELLLFGYTPAQVALRETVAASQTLCKFRHLNKTANYLSTGSSVDFSLSSSLSQDILKSTQHFQGKRSNLFPICLLGRLSQSSSSMLTCCR